MARFTSLPNVGSNTNVLFKITGAVTDADLNKPVKLTATDQVVLCSDGDEIFGFINSVERHPADGFVVVGVQIDGRKKVTLSGTVAIGAVVEAAANTAVGTALGQNWGIVSTKGAIAADLADAASGALIAASVNALLADGLVAKKQWVLISGAGTTGTDGLVEKI